LSDYTLVRSRRRTVAPYVRDVVVEVRAPLKVPKRDIDEFIVSKQKWISDKLSQSTERVKKRKNFSLTYGDSVAYRGKQYAIVESSRIGVSDNYFYVRAGLTPEQIKADCVKIYRILAKCDLAERYANTPRLWEYTRPPSKSTARTRGGEAVRRGSHLTSHGIS